MLLSNSRAHSSIWKIWPCKHCGRISDLLVWCKPTQVHVKNETKMWSEDNWWTHGKWSISRGMSKMRHAFCKTGHFDYTKWLFSKLCIFRPLGGQQNRVTWKITLGVESPARSQHQQQLQHQHQQQQQHQHQHQHRHLHQHQHQHQKQHQHEHCCKHNAIYNVLGQGCFKTSLFTCFWEASAPKQHYLCTICPLILVGL